MGPLDGPRLSAGRVRLDGRADRDHQRLRRVRRVLPHPHARLAALARAPGAVGGSTGDRPQERRGRPPHALPPDGSGSGEPSRLHRARRGWARRGPRCHVRLLHVPVLGDERHDHPPGVDDERRPRAPDAGAPRPRGPRPHQARGGEPALRSLGEPPGSPGSASPGTRSTRDARSPRSRRCGTRTRSTRCSTCSSTRS